MTRKPLREVRRSGVEGVSWPLAMRRKVLESCNSRLSLKTVSWRSPRRETYKGRGPYTSRFVSNGVNGGAEIGGKINKVTEVTTTIKWNYNSNYDWLGPAFYKCLFLEK